MNNALIYNKNLGVRFGWLQHSMILQDCIEVRFSDWDIALDVFGKINWQLKKMMVGNFSLAMQKNFQLTLSPTNPSTFVTPFISMSALGRSSMFDSSCEMHALNCMFDLFYFCTHGKCIYLLMYSNKKNVLTKVPSPSYMTVCPSLALVSIPYNSSCDMPIIAASASKRMSTLVQ